MDDSEFPDSGAVEPCKGSYPQVQVWIDRILDQHRDIRIPQCISYFLNHERIGSGPGADPDHVDSVFHAFIYMFLAGHFGADLHPIFPLHLLEPSQAFNPDTLEGSGMRTGFPYSGTENVDAEVVEAFRRHHYLEFRFGAAGTRYHKRGYAFVEESPLRNGDYV